MNAQEAYKKSSFGPAFFFLNRRQKDALASYYAFCRLADDIADEPCENPQARLNALAQEIEGVYAGTPKTELGKSLLQTRRAFDLSKDRFTLLLEGMQADLDRKRYPSFEALNWYLYRVAVIVGKATLDILQVTGPQADELALRLGRAVQLTNIIRDVYDDARLGRVYLPLSITPQEILAGTRAQEVKTLLEQTAALARQNYACAFARMNEFPSGPMLPCRVMGYTYQKNLAKIEETSFTYTETIKLNKREKLQSVFYALVKTIF